MGADIFQTKLLAVQDNLYNFAILLTSNRDNAYDLLQDTTLKALDNRDKYAEGTNFNGWIFTIMRNIFINNYRRQNRELALEDINEGFSQMTLAQVSTSLMPENTITSIEINQAIDNIIQVLREPLRMHIVGYKYYEISDKLDLPIGTVKSRIYMARKMLQQQFADYR